MTSRTSEIGKLIHQKIAEIDPAAEIILYGSRARGDEREDSDWDILVLTNYPVDLKKESAFRDHLYDLEIETGESFSLFAYSKADWNTKQQATPLYQSVAKEGVNI